MGRGYGYGGDPAGRARRRRIARHIATHASTVDERDVGNRPGIERVFGLDGPEWSIDGCVVRPEVAFRALAHRWMTRGA